MAPINNSIELLFNVLYEEKITAELVQTFDNKLNEPEYMVTKRLSILIISTLSSKSTQHSPVKLEYYRDIITIGQHDEFWNIQCRLQYLHAIVRRKPSLLLCHPPDQLQGHLGP